MTEAVILKNLFDIERIQNDIPWQPFLAGVDIHWLYQTDETGPAAALIRFHPGARVPLHQHMGYEHILVLSGSQTDQNGHLSRGALMIHPPDTQHAIASDEGCIVLAIYGKRVSFLPAG